MLSCDCAFTFRVLVGLVCLHVRFGVTCVAWEAFVGFLLCVVVML